MTDSANESIFQECISVRKNCGVFDHPDRGIIPPSVFGPKGRRGTSKLDESAFGGQTGGGIIEVRGADCIPFLQNVLSNDIKNLRPGKGVSACLLNAQAKIIVNFNVLCFDQRFWLTCDYILKDRALEHFKKLIIMEKVELADRSDELKLLSIHGPKAKELLRMALNQESVPDAPLDHINKTVDGVNAHIVRINLAGEVGFALLSLKEKVGSVRAVLDRNGTSVGLIKLHAPALEIMRIAGGIPRYGVDFDESNNPLEAGLEHTVSFTKGCFPGQEILARLDSRGGVSKKLCGLVVKGEIIPKKGDRIAKDDVQVGYITSAAFSPTLKKTIALGYLNKEFWTVGCLLVVETAEAHLPARVEPLPFYTPNPS